MKHLSLLFSFILASLSLSAQDAISYQAVARNAEGKILSEQQIGVKVEILQGSAEGAAVYSETHEAETSPTGVVNLSIGMERSLPVLSRILIGVHRLISLN